MTMHGRADPVTSNRYEVRELQAFTKSIKKYFRKQEEKIRAKIEEELPENPHRYRLLEGGILIVGIKVVGLHRMKAGVPGHRGGALVFYRICEECLVNRYYVKTKAQCDFCDPEIKKRVVLFASWPRGRGYK